MSAPLLPRIARWSAHWIDRVYSDSSIVAIYPSVTYVVEPSELMLSTMTYIPQSTAPVAPSVHPSKLGDSGESSGSMLMLNVKLPALLTAL